MIIDGNSIMERNIELMKKDILGVMLVMIMVCCTILSGCGKKAAMENTVKNGSTKNEIETEYNNTTETESADTENTNTENTNTGYEIPTEYDMEEYADGYIIVSKTDHLLYGVIDIDGREVIPVEYDNIDFVRRNGEVDIDQGIYFLCEYEGEKQVLNSSGEKVLDGDIECNLRIWEAWMKILHSFTKNMMIHRMTIWSMICHLDFIM